ncbi:nuclear transport factor 2 family protein [Pseudarthrobacter sp. H2]|uniref:nuclear transport factor 2 family protein n=1 Tax=Pseudarthrobacter sp. H2 TaxID=3418415 RepID=UPI003CF1BE52
MHSSEQETLRWLVDREQIRELVNAYCRAIDRVDLDALLDLYTSDGVDHHTGFDGPVTEFVPWLRGLMPGLTGTQHIIGTHLAEVHGDEAVAESSATAVHWAEPNDDPELNYISGVRYIDHLVRTATGWRIRERWAVREWAITTAGCGRALSGGIAASRGAEDPLWGLLSAVRGAPAFPSPGVE